MSINEIIILNDLLRAELNKYQNLSINKICKEFNINDSPKNINSIIFRRIIENSPNYKEIKKLLDKYSCIIKTINLEWNDALKESMSLASFKYIDIASEEWDNSSLKLFFSKTVFIFVVFKKEYNDSFLKNVKVWKMPEGILESGVKDVWEKTKNLVCEGKIVNYIDSRGRYITYFPTSSETKFIHVRPHAQNKYDTFPLPVPDRVTGIGSFVKHSFWLNSSFIKKIVVEGKYYD